MKHKNTIQERKKKTRDFFIEFFKSDICGMKMIDFYFCDLFEFREKHFILENRYDIFYEIPYLTIKKFKNNYFLLRFSDGESNLNFLDCFNWPARIQGNKIIVNMRDIMLLIATNCEYDDYHGDEGTKKEIIYKVKNILSSKGMKSDFYGSLDEYHF